MAPDLESEQPFHGHLTAADVRRWGLSDPELSSRPVVISLACGSGTPELTEAWLTTARAYIAPAGYPEADDALIFAAQLFWRLLALDEDLETAFSKAAGLGRDTALFRLFT